MSSSTPDNGNYPHLTDHQSTWGNFCQLAKWVIIGSVILLVLMAAFLTGDHRSIGG